MERRKFEDSFKDAFQDAQVSPSESVWTSIELDLERAEGGKMKRRILFYKMLAAASVVFGMSVAGIGYYMIQGQTTNADNQTAQVKNLPAATVPEHKSEDSNAVTLKINDLADAENSVADAGNSAEGAEESEIILSDSKSKPSETNAFSSATNSSFATNSDTRSALASGKDFSRANGVKANGVNDNSTSEVSTPGVNSVRTTHIQDDGSGLTSNGVVHQKSISFVNAEHASGPAVKRLPNRIKPETSLVSPTVSEVDPVERLLAQAAQREKELSDEKDDHKDEKNNNERVWTSVGVAAGAFSSTNTSVAPSVSALNSNADQQVKASGVAYSMGVSVGTRLSNRWVLQGGLNYQTQSSDYTANSVMGSPDLQNFYAASMNSARDDAKLLNTVPYSVNNSLQFLNVPLQAGYLVINQKIGVQLNAGVSTDFFLQNTITPESRNVNASTQGAGDESPYRTVNISGLVGTELTYKFGTRYRIALNPGLRYPFNSIYKSSEGVEAAPLTFDVGLRFRYIFNQ